MKRLRFDGTMAIVAVALVLGGFLAGCAPTPFVAGREVGTPAGCIEARERGHEC